MFPLKPPKFKFKYFHSSQNPSDGTFVLASNMAFGSKGGVQSTHQLATLKGKQLAIAIEVPMIFFSPLNESLV
jgi:hypothetical protein